MNAGRGHDAADTGPGLPGSLSEIALAGLLNDIAGRHAGEFNAYLTNRAQITDSWLVVLLWDVLQARV